MKKTWIYGRVTGGRGGKKAKQGKKRIIIEPLRRNMKTNNKKTCTVLVTKTQFSCCRYIGLSNVLDQVVGVF